MRHRRASRNGRAIGIVLLLAFVFDLWGEPSANWHPVIWFGRLIRWLERGAPRGRLPQLLYGAAMPVIAAPLVCTPAALIHKLALRLRAACSNALCGDLLYALVEGGVLKPFFALQMLAEAGRAVRLPLEQHDLPAARQALQSLVSRDRSQLSAELAAAAAIESLAENLSDSVVAPLFYYALFGLPGAALYRLCNTFDSMIGYHEHYEYLGKAAARLDDLLNLLPSRLSALLIIGCAPLFGGDQRRAWRIWRRDARKTASPNAGQPMAAMAGALGIQLEKVGHYQLGDAERPPTPADIRKAELMVWRVGILALLLVMGGRIVWSARYD
ncbi:cobalamin biosynthesis protein CobD [Reticulibacter mediterranei]|uniref:Cobalamin biosynthesis protein CobD n=2 Tax=Reticulibacter mediterranei TaxID=2778369 RepID=A0A8J3IMU8_9CHLR|nr:cobalamin biosynthesis protein CobD [Reticulibacter mediterranei]